MLYHKIDSHKLKQNHSFLFNSLREIINYHNPLNIVHLSEAPDEYDPEVAEALSRIKPYMNLQEIHELVFEIFKQWFHPLKLEKKDFSALALSVYNWLDQNKSGFIIEFNN